MSEIPEVKWPNQAPVIPGLRDDTDQSSDLFEGVDDDDEEMD